MKNILCSKCRWLARKARQPGTNIDALRLYSRHHRLTEFPAQFWPRWMDLSRAMTFIGSPGHFEVGDTVCFSPQYAENPIDPEPQRIRPSVHAEALVEITHIQQLRKSVLKWGDEVLISFKQLERHWQFMLEEPEERDPNGETKSWVLAHSKRRYFTTEQAAAFEQLLGHGILNSEAGHELTIRRFLDERVIKIDNRRSFWREFGVGNCLEVIDAYFQALNFGILPPALEDTWRGS